MIKTVLLWVLVLFILALVAFWFWSGGFEAVRRTAHTLINPVDLFWSGEATGSPLRLPWQPSDMTRGPDISGYATEADAIQARMSPEDQDGAYVSENDARIKTFGNPSAYAGIVRITGSAATESGAGREYIEIRASESANAPVEISGWSLQSAVSGLRAYVGQGVEIFGQGVVNEVRPVFLQAGDRAFITTGASPVGASFKENICSGYLAQSQQFAPDMTGSCPSPGDALPQTADTLRTYGPSCFDYLASLPSCETQTKAPASLSANCLTFIGSTISYNGCVSANRGRGDFSEPAWRIYLGVRSALWYDTHDVIRLLDGEGRIVDVLSY